MTHPAPIANPSLDLTDIIAWPAFIKDCEARKIATRGQLQWWARYRHINNLAASGALVEKRVHPGSSRPMLFVVRPRFVAWLAGQDSPRAAA